MVVTNKKEILDHVFNTLEIPEEVQDFFKSTWQIKSVGMLINIDQEKMMDQDEIAHGHVAAIALFIEWLKQYIMDHEGKTPLNWEFEFTEDIWEDYILHRGANKGGGISTTTEEGSNASGETPADEITSQGTSVAKVNPIKVGIPFVQNSPFNNAMPLVKIDVRSYPEFDGALKNWKSYKQKFKSIASMHKIGDLITSTYQVPSDSVALQEHYAKNAFLQSILEYSLAKGNALTRVKKFSVSKDGQSSWKELVIWYEGQGSVETLARKALTIIHTHRLSTNSFGGAEVYMEKFETALQDLEEIGKPYDQAMAKINFLTNIQDDEYKIVKENLEMNDDKTYHDCLIEIRRKSISVENERKNRPNPRRSNRQKSTAKINNLKKRMGEHYVEPSKWRTMTKAERDAHIKKYKASKKGNNNEPSPPPSSTGLPTQYANNTMTNQERELYDHMMNNQSTTSSLTGLTNNQNEELSTHQTQYLNMIRSINASRSASANVVRTYSSSNKVQTCMKSTKKTCVFDEEWLEDDKEKYLNIIRKANEAKALTKTMESEPSIRRLFDINEETAQCYGLLSFGKETMLDSWMTGNSDSLFEGFGKKVKEKLETAMCQLFNKNKFREKFDVMEVTPNLPVVRNINLSKLSSMNRAQTEGSSKNDHGQLLIDGGCDTTLVGRGFQVEGTSERTVNVQGFQKDMQINRLPVVTAVTALDLPNETVILEFNEAIFVEGNENSLVSTFQVREYGNVVNDVAKRHGGKQNILADECEIPLSVMNGLLVCDVRKPTETERINCTRVIMTGDNIWDVEKFDDGESCNYTNKMTSCDIFAHILSHSPSHVFSLKRKLSPARSTLNQMDVKKIQSKLGWIPMQVAEATMKVTTQLAKNHLRLPLRHHFKSRFPQLNRNRLRETYSTDTIFSSVPALNTNETCMQIFCGKVSKFCRGYGLKSETHGVQALQDFVTEVGAPYRIINDNAKMEISEAWKKILRTYNIDKGTTEPYHPHQNPVERRIQEIKKVSLSIMDHANTPDSLWLMATKYAILLLNHTANKSIGGITPIERAFGVTPDISALLQYAFYEPVFYLDSVPNSTSFPRSKEKLGRFVGIAEATGDALTYYVLTSENKIIARSVMRSALDAENLNLRALGSSNVEELRTNIFHDRNIHRNWDGDVHEDAEIEVNTSPILQSTQDISGPKELPTVDPNELIGFNFVMQNKNGIEERVTVTDWTKEGQFIIEFLNGGQELMLYNDLINYYEKEKEENADFYTFKRIEDHKFEKGKWKVLIIWENDDRTWETFKSIKETDPISLAKYAHDKNMINTPGWKWCKKYSKDPTKFIRLSRVFAQQRMRKGKKYKFGVEIPRNIKHAMELDRLNGNNKWGEATDKEVSEILEHATFIIVDNIKDIPKGYAFIPLQFVYDNKFDGRRKGRLVACGNFTDPDIAEIYSGVVGIEKVRILFVIADMNGLILIAADVCNAYLNGFTKEKLYSQIDYGKLKGKWLIISKALYGLKTSAARWADAIAEILRQIGFSPSYADTEIWMRDKGDHYEYIAVYVDDLIIASKDPMGLLNELEKAGNYKFKGVGVPEYYLGGDIKKIINKDLPYQTVISAKTYIKNISDKIERLFEFTLRNYHSPLEGGYHPELDRSELLTGDDVSRYRMLIGSLNWAVTLGRIDVMFAAVTMARYNHAPREGHMKVMFRIFGYLKNHSKASLKMDFSAPEEPVEGIVKANWKHLYPGAHEKLPHNPPKPKGKPIRVWGEFDADNAHDLETRRSVSGILIYINNSVVKWYSKRQNTIETSTYGSELVSCRTAVELLIDMRYSIRMLGVPLLYESWLYGDNQAVILNCSRPESVLRKKHHACAFHFIRETSSIGWLFLVRQSGLKSRSDILTKALSPAKLYEKLKGWMFNS